MARANFGGAGRLAACPPFPTGRAAVYPSCGLWRTCGRAQPTGLSRRRLRPAHQGAALWSRHRHPAGQFDAPVRGQDRCPCPLPQWQAAQPRRQARLPTCRAPAAISSRPSPNSSECLRAHRPSQQYQLRALRGGHAQSERAKVVLHHLGEAPIICDEQDGVGHGFIRTDFRGTLSGARGCRATAPALA
jgi:hypothetical protein